MAAAKVRESLHHLIDSIEDEDLLHAYLKIIEKTLPTASDPIVGYTTKGEAITQSALVKRAREASNRVKSGDYVAQEDLEKESENW